MILINSIHRDIATDTVMKWLLRYKASVLRLNETCHIEKLTYNTINNRETLTITLKDQRELHLHTLNAYWYRRGDFQLMLNTLEDCPIDDFREKTETFLMNEQKALFEYFLDYLKRDVFCIGDLRSCTHVNKTSILSSARKFGLNVPDSLVTGSKKELLNFYNVHKNIISKPLNNAFLYSTEDHWYPTYTEQITEEIALSAPEHFQSTLFQKNIIKKLEIRSFYLLGAFYSMAIFSQNDPQTATDFRVYNDTKPNRTVPFNLPSEIEEKLKKLMQYLRFESGSIDLLYTPEKEIYFLEVNPVGQFGMVSYPCNYQLEKRIAETLVHPHEVIS